MGPHTRRTYEQQPPLTRRVVVVGSSSSRRASSRRARLRPARPGLRGAAEALAVASGGHRGFRPVVALLLSVVARVRAVVAKRPDRQAVDEDRVGPRRALARVGKAVVAPHSLRRGEGASRERGGRSRGRDGRRAGAGRRRTSTHSYAASLSGSRCPHEIALSIHPAPPWPSGQVASLTWGPSFLHVTLWKSSCS